MEASLQYGRRFDQKRSSSQPAWLAFVAVFPLLALATALLILP